MAKATPERKMLTELLKAIDGIFELDVKYGWRIVDPKAAERFYKLQQLAKRIHANRDE